MFCAARLEGHCCRRPLVPVIGCARPLLVWWVQEVCGRCRGDWELPRPRLWCGITGPVGLVSLCVQEEEANFHRERQTGAPSSSVAAASA
jgi:hypothetical protein